MDVQPAPREFDWDGHNSGHIRVRHQIDPAAVEETFFNLSRILKVDNTHSRAEARDHLLGKTNTGRTLLVVFTLRNKKIRPITARDASRKEKIIYEKAQKDSSI